MLRVGAETGFVSWLMNVICKIHESAQDVNNNNSLYWNQVDNRNLLQWHIKQAATLDSTTLYNRTQSFGTQAFKSTKYNTSFSTER